MNVGLIADDAIWQIVIESRFSLKLWVSNAKRVIVSFERHR